MKSEPYSILKCIGTVPVFRQVFVSSIVCNCGHHHVARTIWRLSVFLSTGSVHWLQFIKHAQAHAFSISLHFPPTPLGHLAQHPAPTPLRRHLMTWLISWASRSHLQALDHGQLRPGCWTLESSPLSCAYIFIISPSHLPFTSHSLKPDSASWGHYCWLLIHAFSHLFICLNLGRWELCLFALLSKLNFPLSVLRTRPSSLIFQSWPPKLAEINCAARAECCLYFKLIINIYLSWLVKWAVGLPARRGGLTKLISVYFSIGQRFCGAIDYKALALKPSDQPISQRQWKLNCKLSITLGPHWAGNAV